MLEIIFGIPIFLIYIAMILVIIICKIFTLYCMYRFMKTCYVSYMWKKSGYKIDFLHHLFYQEIKIRI